MVLVVESMMDTDVLVGEAVVGDCVNKSGIDVVVSAVVPFVVVVVVVEEEEEDSGCSSLASPNGSPERMQLLQRLHAADVAVSALFGPVEFSASGRPKRQIKRRKHPRFFDEAEAEAEDGTTASASPLRQEQPHPHFDHCHQSPQQNLGQPEMVPVLATSHLGGQPWCPFVAPAPASATSLHLPVASLLEPAFALPAASSPMSVSGSEPSDDESFSVGPVRQALHPLVKSSEPRAALGRNGHGAHLAQAMFAEPRAALLDAKEQADQWAADTDLFVESTDNVAAANLVFSMGDMFEFADLF
eukprot:m.24695 g.24695  ORF g.24695 m.24695 type:complete len:301 (+) comp11244_c0_seq1:135-1037(+)